MHSFIPLMIHWCEYVFEYIIAFVNFMFSHWDKMIDILLWNRKWVKKEFQVEEAFFSCRTPKTVLLGACHWPRKKTQCQIQWSKRLQPILLTCKFNFDGKHFKILIKRGGDSDEKGNVQMQLLIQMLWVTLSRYQVISV